MFDSVSFVLFATSSPILVNFALRHPYPWLHAIFLAQCFALISSFAALIDAVFLRPLLSSSLKSLPTAVQQSVWTRLLKEPAGDALSQFMQQNPNSPIIRYFGVLNSERLLLTHPKDIQQVLDSQAYEFGRSYLIRRLLSPVLGKNSLVVSDGAEHIKCRADIHSDFYSQHVAELCPMFWQNAGSLIEAMTACSEGLDGQAPESNHAIDIVKWLEKAAFQIIVSAFFGSAACSDKSFLDELLQEFRGAFSISSGLYAQAEMAWETILPLHVFFGLISLDDVRKAKRSMQGVRALCQKHIAQRRAKVCQNATFLWRMLHCFTNITIACSIRQTLARHPTRISWTLQSNRKISAMKRFWRFARLFLQLGIKRSQLPQPGQFTSSRPDQVYKLCYVQRSAPAFPSQIRSEHRQSRLRCYQRCLY
jgi:hypothetical protein